ncbi:MAG: hypothetical protein ACTJLK_03500 [Anaplasma sp.]
MFDLSNTYDLALRVEDDNPMQHFSTSNGHMTIKADDFFISHLPLQYCNTGDAVPDADNHCRSHVVFGRGEKVLADMYNSALSHITFSLSPEERFLQAHFAINPMQILPFIDDVHPDLHVEVHSE